MGSLSEYTTGWKTCLWFCFGETQPKAGRHNGERTQEVQSHSSDRAPWWRWKLPSSCPCPLLALVSMVSFPTLQEISKAPEQFFSLECQKKKKGKKQQQEFHGNISLGFCKILSHPHMEPKAQARTESAGIAPLTYCSDMQIPSLPLKTESTSTFKANFGFIVHVAPRSIAAQHSWLAHTPADTVPGSSATPPKVPGA